MNRWIRNRPIRQKVALLIVVAAVLALLLSGIAVVAYEQTTVRPRLLRDAEAQAALMRVNSVPALQFNDTTAAAENLRTLSNRPDVLAATLFRADGTILARYAVRGGPPPAALQSGARFLPGRLVLVDRIEVDGRLAGWLSLQMEVPPLWRRLLQYGIVAAVVLLALGTASILLLGMMARSVSAPLLG
ncbi:MAG TPA: CHASE sensor domain-containing protein, partial [Gemmatimonadales bacterium]